MLNTLDPEMPKLDFIPPVFNIPKHPSAHNACALIKQVIVLMNRRNITSLYNFKSHHKKAIMEPLLCNIFQSFHFVQQNLNTQENWSQYSMVGCYEALAFEPFVNSKKSVTV